MTVATLPPRDRFPIQGERATPTANNQLGVSPERQGILNLTIANDNQSYSSKVIHQINEILKDTPIRFDDLNLKYFQHYYAKLMNQID